MRLFLKTRKCHFHATKNIIRQKHYLHSVGGITIAVVRGILFSVGIIVLLAAYYQEYDKIQYNIEKVE